MSKVYMVHREHGDYSDWTYDVLGVFSTEERAERYLSRVVLHVRNGFGYRSWYDEPGWNTHPVALAKADDGTWAPDCGESRLWGEPTYFVTEYELDGLEGEVDDA